MARRARPGWALLALILALAPCASQTRGSPEVKGAPFAGPPPARPPDPAKPPAPEPSAAEVEELSWDTAVGWEHRVHFLPGEITRKRPEENYLRLRYAWLRDAKMFKLIATAKIPLRDRSLIATPADLCEPALRTVIAELAPDRLFIRIEAGLTPAQVECLARLQTPRLYLAMCPDEYVSPRCDGDAELAALAGNPRVAERVRGLAISFAQPGSWAHFPKFPALEYLAVHGAALKEADWQAVLDLCRRPGLRHLDVMDPYHPAGSLFEELESCALPRQIYFGWKVPQGPPHWEGPCNLRRVLAGKLSEPRRSELQVACPALKEIETVYSN